MIKMNGLWRSFGRHCAPRFESWRPAKSHHSNNNHQDTTRINSIEQHLFIAARPTVTLHPLAISVVVTIFHINALNIRRLKSVGKWWNKKICASVAYNRLINRTIASLSIRVEFAENDIIQACIASRILSQQHKSSRLLYMHQQNLRKLRLRSQRTQTWRHIHWWLIRLLFFSKQPLSQFALTEWKLRQTFY